MRVLFKTGNIVDEPVEGLVCSGNVQLNMSGGVNGELLSRGGRKMQEELHGYLRERQVKYVDPGFVMAIGPEPTQFKCIVYTVSIDAFYESSVEMVCSALTNSLRLIQEAGCKTVAIPALATGYGHLSKNDCGKALRRGLDHQEWAFEEVRIVLLAKHDLSAVRDGYGEGDG